MSSFVQFGQSTPGSDNSASDSSEVVDNLALVQFDGLERSDHSSETNPVPAVHQPPSSAAVRKKTSLLSYSAVLLFKLISWFPR